MEPDSKDEEPFYLTDEQKKEILRRDTAFVNGETETRVLDDVIRDLERRYTTDESQ